MPAWFLPVVAVVTLVFVIFTWWLLNSTPRDRSVGYLFVGVDACLFAWVTMITFFPGTSRIFGIIATISQLLITFVLLVTHGVTSLVIAVSLVPALMLATLVAISWRGKPNLLHADG